MRPRGGRGSVRASYPRSSAFICGLTVLLALGAFAFTVAAPARLPAVAVPAAPLPPGTFILPPATGAATRPATAPTTVPAVIPKADLVEMYRRELGPLFNPADADRIYAVHLLIERYFEVSTGAERKALVEQIRASNLDPNVLGRITRLRMYWPALEGGAVYYVNEQVGPHPVRYFVGVPKDYDRTKPWPLVIKLPTAAAFLTDPPPDGDRVAQIYTNWIKEELARHPDAVVLMPLLNLGELYGPSYAGMNTVFQPMLHVAGRANIDPARVYLLGHSMSAHAVWNLALHYTTYFAAINPLAGGAAADWQRLRVVNLRNVLPVVWHDAEDQVVRVESSRALVRALRRRRWTSSTRRPRASATPPATPSPSGSTRRCAAARAPSTPCPSRSSPTAPT